MMIYLYTNYAMDNLRKASRVAGARRGSIRSLGSQRIEYEPAGGWERAALGSAARNRAGPDTFLCSHRLADFAGLCALRRRLPSGNLTCVPTALKSRSASGTTSALVEAGLPTSPIARP